MVLAVKLWDVFKRCLSRCLNRCLSKRYLGLVFIASILLVLAGDLTPSEGTNLSQLSRPFSQQPLLQLPSSRQSSRQAQALTVAVNRWLELRSLTGQVLYQSATGERSAQVGLRLQAVGEGIRTLSNATAMLAIDAGTGFINVSENTSLKIQALTTSNGGGRITQLQVLSGQVHLEVPTFTNPDSRLEIQTPSGWSGVRGTEFGIAVKPDGSTGTATLSGAVETSAQNQNVVVEGGFQNLIFPGEPPTQPVPITDDTTLSLTTIDTDRELAYLSGYTDPFNLLSIEGVAQVLDREGRFAISMPLPDDAGVRAVVTTPLGKEQAYEIQLF